MFNVPEYIQKLTQLLKENLGDRLLYVGLQGSYLRGEATENSDLDIIVIISDISPADLEAYRRIISGLEHPEKACGFICGKKELYNWNPLEICSLIHGTRDYFGRLSDHTPTYSKEDIKNFIKLSVGNLYHEICHRYIHSDLVSNIRKLPHSYKNVFFILQNVYYLKDGVLYQTKKGLMEHLYDCDREVMEMAMHLSVSAEYNFDEAYSLLFTWCQKILSEV